MSETETGTVIWFNSKKGFGFIARGNGQKDIFVHYTNILSDGFKKLTESQKVSFEIGENHKGEQAVNVKVLED